MAIKKVLVIGAGTMGRGIAQIVAQAGYETFMVARHQESLDRAVAATKQSLNRFVENGKMTQAEMDKTLALLHTSRDLKAVAKNVDYVIENVFESPEVKLPIFKELDETCPKETILSSDTSGIPISLLSSATKRPDKVVGMHFMNPVTGIKGMEIGRTLLTSDETVRVSLDFAKSIGKEAVVVRDSPGLVENRIIALLINEAIKLAEENLATVEDIDKILKLSNNWLVGPFEIADMAGLDVMEDLLEGIYRQTGWERYKPAKTLKRMVELGYLGNKVGKGFYTLFGKK